MKKKCGKKSLAGGADERAKPPVEGIVLQTVNDLAKRYGVCERTIFNWIDERRISHYKLGRALRFNPVECDQDLQRFRIPARH